MRSFASAAIALILMLGAIGAGGTAEQASLQVPQSIRVQHDQIMTRLATFAKHQDPVGAAASKALAVLKAHYAKEEAFVLPPLGLLPRIAKGEISKDMKPAIAMGDRVRASWSEFQNDHIEITSLMNELIEAGMSTHNDELVRLATRIASQSLNHIEVVQPTTIFIGDYLRQRLLGSQ